MSFLQYFLIMLFEISWCKFLFQQEDQAILKFVEEYGSKSWSAIDTFVLGRTSKQCRERLVFDLIYLKIFIVTRLEHLCRFKNQLNPSIRTGPWTAEEERTIVRAQV